MASRKRFRGSPGGGTKHETSSQKGFVMWTDEIPSHYFESMAEPIVCWYLQRNHQTPGFLRILSIHSRFERHPTPPRALIDNDIETD